MTDLVTTQLLVEVVADEAEGRDPLMLLETAIRVAGRVGEMADGMVDHYVGAARAAGLSWTVIGEQLGVSKQAARQRFSARLQTDASALTMGGQLPAKAPRLVACLEAAEAAAEAEQSVVGTQHLLLGLLHVGVAANVLDRLGVTREAVTETSTKLLAARDVDGRRIVGDGEAEAAVLAAQRLAASRGHAETDTQHLLPAIALDPGSSARRVLEALGVEPARMKKELDDLLPDQRSGRRVRRTGKPDRDGRACSFCGSTDADRVMVNGPGVRICNECVVLATDVVASRATPISGANP